MTDEILLNDWHVVAHTKELQPNTVLCKRLLGEDVVLWRYDDKIHAWQDFCPHRGARLSLGQVEGESLICPYHGFAYNTDGKCVRIPSSGDRSIPSRACIKTYRVQERYDLIWVCLGTPKWDIFPFPEWDDPSYRQFFGGPYHYQSSAQRVVENFSDLSHVCFVHQGILGDPHQAKIEPYEVEWHPEGFTFSIGVWQPRPEGADSQTSLVYNIHHFKIFRPLTAYFQRGEPDNRFTIFYTITPVEEEEAIGWMWMGINYRDEIPDAELREFQDYIVNQDIPIVESQRPKRLPLDGSEFHVASDRASIAYRKWLKQLGVTFGTISSSIPAPNK